MMSARTKAYAGATEGRIRRVRREQPPLRVVREQVAGYRIQEKFGELLAERPVLSIQGGKAS